MSETTLRDELIALTSGMGSIAESSGCYVPYRSSKAALNMAWHSLAIEAKRLGVVAAVLDPGWVKTRMGGANAPTPPEKSVAEMRRLIGRLGPPIQAASSSATDRGTIGDRQAVAGCAGCCCCSCLIGAPIDQMKPNGSCTWP